MIPRISIIMPARNEGVNLQRTLDSLLHSTSYPNWEVLILDDASDDASTDFLSSEAYGDDDRLRFLPSSAQLGHVAQRRRGAELASGDVLQFLDAHHRFTPYWLTNLYDALERRGRRGIVGPVLTGLDSATWDMRWSLNWGWSISPELEPSTQNRREDLGPDCSVHWLGGCQMMLTREFNDRLGGLCDLFRGHGTDDTELCLRAWLLGEHCHVEPTAVIGHLYKDHFVNPVTWTDLTANYLLLAYLTGGQSSVDRLAPRRAGGHGYPGGLELFERMREQAAELRQHICRHQRRELSGLWARPERVAVSRSRPDFSLVVVAHDEGDHVRRTVESIRSARDSASYEIVLVDDGSTDGSFDSFLEAESRSTGIRLVRLPERTGCNVARQRGAAVAEGEHLVFLDAHMAVPDGWLTRLQSAAERYGPGALLSPDIAALDPTHWTTRPSTRKVIALDERMEFRWGGLEHFGGLLSTVVGCCICMPADLYRLIGGFDTGLRAWGSEFVDLVAKVYATGGFVVHVPEVLVGHLFRSSFPYSMTCADVTYNKLRTGSLHLPAASFERLREILSREPGFAEADARLCDDSAALERLRSSLVSRRPNDWWVRTFRSDLRAPRCPRPGCEGQPRWAAQYCGTCGTELIDGVLDRERGAELLVVGSQIPHQPPFSIQRSR